MRHILALVILLVFLILVIAAWPANAARCPHGQILRVHLGRCVGQASPLALAYARPLHKIRIKIPLPAEPPLKPDDISPTVPDPDPAIKDIPLTDPDPARMALKLQLEKK